MKQEKGFKFFILGMLVYAAIIPLIESLVVLIQSFIEVPKGKATIKVTQINDELAEAQERQQYQVLNAIGFQARSTEDYYDDEDDF